jgi:hypothetical protein
VKDQILLPEYNCIFSHNKDIVNEIFDDLKFQLKQLNLHPQLLANLERIKIQELTRYQALLFNLQSVKTPLLINTDHSYFFDKMLAFLLPIVHSILKREQFPVEFPCSPFAIILENSGDKVLEIIRTLKMLCHKTNISIEYVHKINPEKKKFYNNLDQCDILVTSVDRIQEFMRKNLLDFKLLDSIVIGNHNLLSFWEKNFMQDLTKKNSVKTKTTVFYSRNSEEFIAYRKSCFRDYDHIVFQHVDKLQYETEGIAVGVSYIYNQNNENINHLVVEYNQDEMKEMYDKVKNLLNVDGLKISNS